MKPVIQNVEDRQIFRLLSHESKLRGISFNSCLDVGCGTNPVDRWFRNYVGLADAPYYAIDASSDVKEKLRLRNVEVLHPNEIPNDFSTDLVIAQEVIEHVHPDEIEDFCESLKKWTGKVLALTCPNFFGFDPIRHCAHEQELRFVPDHLKSFNPKSANPRLHKTATTPEFISNVLTKTFPSSD